MFPIPDYNQNWWLQLPLLSGVFITCLIARTQVREDESGEKCTEGLLGPHLLSPSPIRRNSSLLLLLEKLVSLSAQALIGTHSRAWYSGLYF